MDSIACGLDRTRRDNGSMEEADTLAQDVKEYTLKELQQLKQITEDVLKHWKGMPPQQGAMEKAISLSVKQAEDDLKIINDEIEVKSTKK